MTARDRQIEELLLARCEDPDARHAIALRVRKAQQRQAEDFPVTAEGRAHALDDLAERATHDARRLPHAGTSVGAGDGSSADLENDIAEVAGYALEWLERIYAEREP